MHEPQSRNHQVDFVGTEQDITRWLVDNEADPDTAYWRELTPGELANLDGHYDGYAVPAMEAS
jgi:hypothetical protein